MVIDVTVAVVAVTVVVAIKVVLVVAALVAVVVVTLAIFAMAFVAIITAVMALRWRRRNLGSPRTSSRWRPGKGHDGPPPRCVAAALSSLLTEGQAL